VHDQFTGVSDTTRPAEAERVIGQAPGFLCKKLIEGQSGGWVVLCNVLTDFFTVTGGRARPY